ncbi:MAG: hypothetical protein VX951_07205 [Planctomycetota bacterium]|nr:hypothetical protein [Planctomycetota bacterium]
MHLVSFSVLVVLLSPAPLLLAQDDLAWKLPKRSVVEYRRKATNKIEATKFEGKVPTPWSLRNGLKLNSRRNPPLLYQAELDDSQRMSTESPTAFWDIIPFIGFDMRTAKRGRIRYELPRILPVGDVFVTGSAQSMDDVGVQTLKVTLRSKPPARRDGPTKYFRSLITAHYVHEFKGRLTFTRYIDTDRGLVRGFTARLEGDFKYPNASVVQSTRLVLDEEWQLFKVHPYLDAEFRKRVDKAISDGAKFIRSKVDGLKLASLLPDKRSNDVRGRRSYNAGRLAMALLTMIKAEVDRKDKVLLFAMEELRDRVIYDTYSAGVAAMAFEAYYAPVGERSDLISGSLKKPRMRVVPPADKALIGEWCKQILDNQDTRMDKGYRLAFNYTRGARYDHSVNQYGLLGLYSGHLCGVEITGNIWLGAARHLIEQQCEEHYVKRRFDILTYRDRTRLANDPENTRGASPKTVPMGWNYTTKYNKGRMATGSMTAAGISGLTICAAGLRDLGMEDNDIFSEITVSLRRGHAFMGENFSVRANCAYPPHYDYSRYYYLYGMERAFELSGIAEVMGRDWYHEGAMHLLAWQKKDGSFLPANGATAMLATCFAVLFLKKSALPVYTGGRR